MDRIANIQELKSKLKDTTDLKTFLDDITLFQSSDEDNSIGKVRCLTLHLAKGLSSQLCLSPDLKMV